jgi:amino acid permease
MTGDSINGSCNGCADEAPKVEQQQQQSEDAPLIVDVNEEFRHEAEPTIICGVRIPALLPHGGLAASGFNLASATLGAGTLALPHAMYSSGYVLGTIFLAIVMIATLYAIRLLCVVANKTKLMSYEEMARVLLGSRKWEFLTEFVVVAFCWGITVVYVVAIGSIIDPLRQVHGMPEVFQGTQGLRILTSMYWLVFMLPLSLAKEINTLRYASAVGIMSTCFLVIAIVVHAAQHATNVKSNLVAFKWDADMLMAMPVMMFSYCCQTNVFEIYTELHPRSVTRMVKASTITLVICTTMYVVAGIAGYAEFGDLVRGNILKNYHPTEHPLLAVAFICISITVTMAFPICIFPTRDSILHLLGYHSQYTTPTKVRVLVCTILATGSFPRAVLPEHHRVVRVAWRRVWQRHWLYSSGTVCVAQRGVGPRARWHL